MKNVFLYIFLLISFSNFAQKYEKISIHWQEISLFNFADNSYSFPRFSAPFFHIDWQKELPYYESTISISTPLINPSVEISNLTLLPLSNSEIGNINLKNISETVSASIVSSSDRNVISYSLKLYPFLKQNGSFFKITAFDYQIISSYRTDLPTNKITNFVKNSVLNNGNWFKFYTEKSGIHKISRQFLSQIGLDVSKINPKNIKIYGNGGQMLPLSNAISYEEDLIENAIFVSGESDGSFDNDDYILFYSIGTQNWNEESNTYLNCYDNKSYYFLTIDGAPGKRMENFEEPNTEANKTINDFLDKQFYEIDNYNIGSLGRQWFGELFDSKTEYDFDFNFTNLVANKPFYIKIKLAAAAYAPSSFDISLNSQKIGTSNIDELRVYSGYFFQENTFNFQGNTGLSELNKLKLVYDKKGTPGSKGYLDYISFDAYRKLSASGKQFGFEIPANKETVLLQFENTNGISQILDISNPLEPKSILLNSNKNFKTYIDGKKNFWVVDPADYFIPKTDNNIRVSNQNLKGNIFKNKQGVNEDIDYLIITPESLRAAAQKLADYHATNSNLITRVATLETIYNEFSSGKQDIAAIRNFIKYIYNRASTNEKRLKYVNLFGDASFDYKNRIRNNTNIVPIYQSLYSKTSTQASFASDSFYGLMDENEGNIINQFGGIDIAIGRMLVNNLQQAYQMINKVMEYKDEKSKGYWRNNIVMISDDSDKPSDASLQQKQNQLTDLILSKQPFLYPKKILLDAYPQESSAGGDRYPKAKKDLLDAFEKGALVVNYLGHGGENGLTAERLWEKSDGQNLKNPYKYPLFITITCEFSRFDNPLLPTAGEYTYWNPTGGAIAMITTIRTIEQYSAEIFNEILSKHLYYFDNQENITMAEALRRAKNEYPNSATNVVSFLGDPALELALPRPEIRLEKINDNSIATTSTIFSALSPIKLSGSIYENGIKQTQYQGELTTIVFDKNINKKTLNNDGNAPSMNFDDTGAVIFRGNATISNGQFETEFIVPKDIQQNIGDGKISFYAKTNAIKTDKSGFQEKIQVGGINKNAKIDNIKPTLELYMNDKNFVNGGQTNRSPLLIVQFEDESGINTAGGIGHDISAVIDNDASKTIVLNDYYAGSLDNYKKGSLQYPLRDLSPGMHTLTITAWDVYNNSSSKEITFFVTNDEQLSITHVLNYPNPFTDYTTFWFTHNKAFEPLEVQIRVFTITGRMVWTHNQTIINDGFTSKDISWNGKDDFGNKLAKGVYIYKLTVKSNILNKTIEKIEKLVIL